MFLPFDTERRGNTFQDVIYFIKDSAQVPANLTGSYSLNTTDYPASWITSYALEYVHPGGYEEFRYAETELGQNIKGELRIESYDPATGYISGMYKAVIADLGYVPIEKYPVLTTRPASVEMEGTFKDVKVYRY